LEKGKIDLIMIDGLSFERRTECGGEMFSRHEAIAG
jgi:hypothetical protein